MTNSSLALYGMIFTTEVIYSSFTFLQGLGMLFSVLITTFSCTYVKIYILIGLCGLSFLGGFGIHRNQNANRSNTSSNQN